MKRIILGTMLAVSAAPAIANDLSAAEIEGLRAAMDDNLKDSVSARFKHVKLGNDGVTVCGLVNAKNSYGGYAGFEPFLAIKLSGGRFFVSDIGSAAGQVCRDRGVEP